jgi:hypothetical protein
LFVLAAYFNGQNLSLWGALSALAQNRLYQLFLVAAAVFNIRHILFRLRDRDLGG